jgi:hypothetical protein
MTAEFAILPSGRIEIMIGVHVVGIIYPLVAGRVRYSLALPDATGAREVDSVAKARRIVLHVLADWFDACGAEFRPIAAALAIQAESERAAA